jgi:hypothetical protein
MKKKEKEKHTQNPNGESAVVPPPPAHEPAQAESTSPRNVKLPVHGKPGPFGRRDMTKEFFDTVSTGHIPCLSMPAL